MFVFTQAVLRPTSLSFLLVTLLLFVPFSLPTCSWQYVFRSHPIDCPYLLVLLISLPLAVLTLAINDRSCLLTLLPNGGPFNILLRNQPPCMCMMPGCPWLSKIITIPIPSSSSLGTECCFWGMPSHRCLLSSLIQAYWFYISFSHSSHRPGNYCLMRPEKKHLLISLIYPIMTWFRLSCVCVS